MKPTIHVFCEYGDVNKVERYWQECFYHPDFEAYNINLIEGNYIKQDNLLLSKTLYYHRQFEIFLDLIKNKLIRKDDSIVFADSFNLIAPIIKQFITEFKLKVKLIAFWNPSTFHHDDPNYKKSVIHKFEWRNEYEKLIINTFDYNCFFDEIQFISFRKRISSPFYHRCYITGLPFEYLDRNVKVETDKNIIIFPADANKSDENNFFASIGMGIQSKFRFLKLNESPTIRTVFKTTLPNSIATFFPTYKYYNITMMYECMLHGSIPIVPNYSLYSGVVPIEYQYKDMLVSKRQKGLRGKFELDDSIYIMLSEYNSNVIRNQAEMIKPKFKNRAFINILNK